MLKQYLRYFSLLLVIATITAKPAVEVPTATIGLLNGAIATMPIPSTFITELSIYIVAFVRAGTQSVASRNNEN